MHSPRQLHCQTQGPHTHMGGPTHPRWYTNTPRRSGVYIYMEVYHIAMANAFLFLFWRCSLTVGRRFKRPVFMFLGIYSGFSQNVFFFPLPAFSFVLNCIFCCADPGLFLLLLLLLLLLHFSNKCIISTSSPGLAKKLASNVVLNFTAVLSGIPA